MLASISGSCSFSGAIRSIASVFIICGLQVMPPSIFWREAGQFLRAHTSAFSIISIDALGLQLVHCSIRDSLPPQSQFDRFLSHGQTLSVQGSYYSAFLISGDNLTRRLITSCSGSLSFSGLSNIHNVWRGAGVGIRGGLPFR